MKSLLTWHKKLALFVLIPFIVWALSGLLHPVMNHFAKAERIHAHGLPIKQSELINPVSLKTTLETEGILAISHASLSYSNQQYYYQISRLENNQRVTEYYPVNLNGDASTLTDKEYAYSLAKTWSKKDIKTIEKQTQFDEFYGYNNRILPVYKVILSNNNRLYVDTLNQRIVAHNTPLREQLSYWFRLLHTFNFIGDKHDLTRIIPMLVISSSLLLMGVFGLIAYSLLWRKINTKKWNTQRLHRVSGIVLSLCMLGFASSSTHILIDKLFIQEFRNIEPTNDILVKNINHEPITALLHSGAENFMLVSDGTEVYSQLVKTNKRIKHYEYWQHSKSTFNNAQLATAIIHRQLGVGGKIIHTDKINKFGKTYGFINKRLPVIQVSFEHIPNTVFSVEVSSGYIAALDDQWQRARSWHFGYLHKYHFLNPLSKEVRDSILTFICLGLVFLACMGLRLYLQRRKRQKVAQQRREILFAHSSN